MIWYILLGYLAVSLATAFWIVGWAVTPDRHHPPSKHFIEKNRKDLDDSGGGLVCMALIGGCLWPFIIPVGGMYRLLIGRAHRKLDELERKL